MRYRDRDKLVASLREAADFIEQNGLKLPISDYDIDVRLTTYLYDSPELGTAKEQLRKIAKVLGKSEKDYSGSYFNLKKIFGCFALEFTANREAVCTKKVVGMKTVPAFSQPEREVEVVEWECEDPILKAS